MGDLREAVCYTVCKPVYETQDLHTTRSASRCGRPARSRFCYTVCKPVYETCEQVCHYTVCKPVCETCTKEICYTVCKPVQETCEREVCYTVCKPVTYTQTVQCCSGHWETQCCEKPGPVVTKCCQEPGCWTLDPCSCRCVYCPGECKTVQCQCPPIACCKKSWVPEVCEKQIECVKYVRETCVKKVPYTVCQMVPEQRVKTCTYQVCTWCRSAARSGSLTRSAGWCPSSG